MRRLKSRSLGHLFRMCTEVLDEFHSSRLLDYAHHRKDLTHLYRKVSSAFQKGATISNEKFEHVYQEDRTLFFCRSQSGQIPNTVYTVDMRTQLCNCDDSACGKICKHIVSCARHFGFELLQLPPQTAQTRQRLATIANGSSEDRPFYAEYGAESEPVLRGWEPDSTNPSTDNMSTIEVDESPRNCNRISEAHHQIERIACSMHTIIGTSDVPESLVNGLVKLANKIGNLRTKTGLETLLYGQLLSRSCKGRTIPVQPTSIARRKRASDRSSAQVRGRNSTALTLTERPMKRKRPHSLSEAVRENRPNAKKH
jgi:hypothetical protein